MTKLVHGGVWAFVALIGTLALLATAVFPGLLEAQGDLPLPPSLFAGSTVDISIDGDPYDGVTPIEVLDGDGSLLGTADVADGVWVFQADSEISDTISFRVGDAVSDPFAVVAGAFNADVVLTLPGEAPATVIHDV
ncbi:MAG TPA: hypothetical protein QGF05_00010, partial [Dehalococcoidia bacterium]|nr:hypothetical protein [Dehalococcoidia bacterium]